jgi:hypothetical protein
LPPPPEGVDDDPPDEDEDEDDEEDEFELESPPHAPTANATTRTASSALSARMILGITDSPLLEFR